jgi:hypothetical protein
VVFIVVQLWEVATLQIVVCLDKNVAALQVENVVVVHGK